MANNSVKQIVSYLQKHPFKSENEIMECVFGYCRNSSIWSNKKYAEMLRRGKRKGLIKRTEVRGKRYRYVYYV